MDREAWQITVHGVIKSRTRLNNFNFHLITGILMQLFLSPLRNINYYQTGGINLASTHLLQEKIMYIFPFW